MQTSRDTQLQALISMLPHSVQECSLSKIWDTRPHWEITMKALDCILIKIPKYIPQTMKLDTKRLKYLIYRLIIITRLFTRLLKWLQLTILIWRVQTLIRIFQIFIVIISNSRNMMSTNRSVLCRLLTIPTSQAIGPLK